MRPSAAFRRTFRLGLSCALLWLSATVDGATIPLKVDRVTRDTPVTFGVPFAKGSLRSPDHVRILNDRGLEVPSQITEVTSWAPSDESVQWIWVDFLTDGSKNYRLEFGPVVRRSASIPGRLTIMNSQRANGGLEVDTGVFRFRVSRGEGGFIEEAEMETEGGPVKILKPVQGRGSFLDLLDDAGRDDSHAVVNFTTIEKGSGPLHAILRIEGEYRYARSDNRPAPFVTRVHVWAGKPWLKVLHTLVYTGVPDKRRPQPGQHAHVATRGARLLKEDPTDAGFIEPSDRIQAAGLTLALAETPRLVRTSTLEGPWWQPGQEVHTEVALRELPVRLLQTGPKPNRMPPVPESSGPNRIGGFMATLSEGEAPIESQERAGGWFALESDHVGVVAAFKDVLQEYPKAFTVNPATGVLVASIWPDTVEPMSFARHSLKPEVEEGIETLENGATGLAKTTEMSFGFHAPGKSGNAIQATRALIDPPSVSAAPSWYTASGVFGRIAPRGTNHADLERALDVKFDWWLYNRDFVPWYGMWDYGDGKLNFDPKTSTWDIWGNNEPAQDLQLWMQFARTGDPRFARAAQALSRHSMDIDNIHWPAPPRYRGDTNTPVDYWKTLEGDEGSPYVGLGRRHGAQHWLKTLSAHVWVAGWLANYHLTGDHRGLDMAIQTADMHLRTIFGEHDLTGRRLYLSIWNLSEVWNATKDPRYRRELDLRLERLLALQKSQGDSLVLDRYGYSHHYVIQGLERIVAIEDRPLVKRNLENALISHARRVRDVPPLNHQMESYLSSLGPLVAGYKLTRDEGMLREIRKRLDLLKMTPLRQTIQSGSHQTEIAAAIDGASRLPKDPARGDGRGLWAASNGLRVFGWTHAFSLPYALRLLEELDQENKPPLKKPVSTR